MFRLLVRAHAYLKSDSGPRCVVVLHRAGQNNACVHWTSPQSLICSVIRGETQPTRLRLSSCSPPSLPLSSSLLPPSSQRLRGSTERLSSATKAAVVGRPPFEVSFSKSESVRRRTAAQRSDSELTLHREELSERHHRNTVKHKS